MIQKTGSGCGLWGYCQGMEVNGYRIEPGVNLTGANLTGADPLNANLSDADLGGAHLDGAKLEGANLRGANPPDGEIYD
ncbi:MAG: pentapeptide repeat-containing protein [Gammaproteobacteria bacterium]|nr:pentapeptide repeat-containing protein [Gammaproteobacteria bacterium]